MLLKLSLFLLLGSFSVGFIISEAWFSCAWSLSFAARCWSAFDPFLTPSPTVWIGISCLSAVSDDNEKMESLRQLEEETELIEWSLSADQRQLTCSNTNYWLVRYSNQNQCHLSSPGVLWIQWRINKKIKFRMIQQRRGNLAMVSTVLQRVIQNGILKRFKKDSSPQLTAQFPCSSHWVTHHKPCSHSPNSCSGVNTSTVD